jgi:aminopeptidase N
MFGLLVGAAAVTWLAFLGYGCRLVSAFRGAWRVHWAALSLLLALGFTAAAYFAGVRHEKEASIQRHYFAGIDNQERGDLAAAEREFERVMTLDPGNPRAKEKLEAIRQPAAADTRELKREASVDPSARTAPDSPASGGASGQGRGRPVTEPRTPVDGAGPPTSEAAPTQRDKSAAGSKTARGPAPSKSPEPAKSKGEEPRGQPAPRARLAPHRPSPFEVTRYALDLDLDPAAHTLNAEATVTVRSRGGALRKLDFSLNPEFKPDQVMFDGKPAGFTHVNDLLTVEPKRSLPGNGEAKVLIRYRREGPAVVKSAGDLISEEGTYLRSEGRWYPATGELDFRAPVRVRARVPRGYSVVSVGSLRETLKDEKGTRFHWQTDRVASMVSLAAARYEQKSVLVPPPAGVERSAPLKVTCYTFAQHRGRAAAFLKEAAAIVRFYEGQFGPYPYEKLAVVEIPMFPGGYGTTSFVMLMDQAFAAASVDREFLAHEIAHQWWGNSVFPQGLGAAWLTEAFSNYSAWMYASGRAGNPRVLQKRVARATSDYFRQAKAMGDQAIAEADPYVHVGAAQQIIYEKGAVILHTLRRHLGDRLFRETMRRFAADYRFGKARIGDFQQVAEKVSGEKLDWFFAQWLGRTGGMALSYSFETVPETPSRNRVVLHLNQLGPPYQARLKLQMQVDDSVQTQEIDLKDAAHTYSFPIRGKVSSVLLDPDNTFLMPVPRWIVPDS